MSATKITPILEAMVIAAGDKLRAALYSEIQRSYPELTEREIDRVFAMIGSTIEDWYAFMNRWIIPRRKEIQEFQPENDHDDVLLPALIPGMTLLPVPHATYVKVNGVMSFYLNLYDHVDSCLSPKKNTN